jgi:methionyl-tRNA formyltransferase
MSRVRALFFGTPSIAVPALEALNEIAEVALVICQPDRPSGRGLEVKPVPVKVRALSLGLPVVQPAKIRTPEFAEWVSAANADVALVIAYGRILPPAILSSPRHGCLNLHASILPRYRGAAPITWSIVRGEKETGITLMQMAEGLDTGPVYSIHRTPIREDVTADDLAIELGALASLVVRHDLPRVLTGELLPVPQNDAEATLAPLLKKEDGRIDWTLPARAVHDHARGMTSWPGAFTSLEGKLLKVLATKIESEDSAPEGASSPPGTVVYADKSGVAVACGKGRLNILRAQAEGRKALSGAELAAGRTIRAGMVLGA